VAAVPLQGSFRATRNTRRKVGPPAEVSVREGHYESSPTEVLGKCRRETLRAPLAAGRSLSSVLWPIAPAILLLIRRPGGTLESSPGIHSWVRVF
jgi:hypothetical protein